MMKPTHLDVLPYPFGDLTRIPMPPTAIDLGNVLKPLLEQAESVAGCLHAGLHSAAYCGEEPARFVPTALLLQETLQAALALFVAWEHEERQPSSATRGV